MRKPLNHKKNSGFTLIELLLTVALVGIITLAIVQLGSPMIRFFKGSQARQQGNLEARVCLERIRNSLVNAKSNTLAISTPDSSPTVQASRADFQTVDGRFWAITWSARPMNTVHLLQLSSTGSLVNDTLLASNVTGLTFEVDTQDPSLINTVLAMKIPLNSSGSADSYQRVLLTPQQLRLSAF